ncbi:hypothetical protein PLICRDRAFT_180839 [Plicaturopsis crispa FD-325 SS-3]|uniref:Uncharacterized protein n=1 Tax=Plicaturopsis crispa FD-325 SS-3 TaxID=944288 RepID=A0A0C9T4F1_PLICR|nr:hypothetical protein PLICRDRAFT_180839 [Plicaturopsis crispa FD-325 SS-3]
MAARKPKTVCWVEVPPLPLNLGQDGNQSAQQSGDDKIIGGGGDPDQFVDQGHGGECAEAPGSEGLSGPQAWLEQTQASKMSLPNTITRPKKPKTEKEKARKAQKQKQARQAKAKARTEAKEAKRRQAKEEKKRRKLGKNGQPRVGHD